MHCGTVLYFERLRVFSYMYPINCSDSPRTLPLLFSQMTSNTAYVAFFALLLLIVSSVLATTPLPPVETGPYICMGQHRVHSAQECYIHCGGPSVTWCFMGDERVGQCHCWLGGPDSADLIEYKGIDTQKDCQRKRLDFIDKRADDPVLCTFAGSRLILDLEESELD